MKNTFKIIISLSLLMAFGACTTNDKDPVVSANGFNLAQPVTGTTYVLTPQNAASDLLTLTWDKSDNGVTAVPVYTIEIAESGTNFADPLIAVKTSDLAPADNYTWKVGYLNELLNRIGFAPCESLNIDVRVKSTLGTVENNAFIQYSNVVSLSVTPYSLDLPLLAFSADSTITTATPKLAASGILNTDYEGYMWLNAGSYKFYKPNSCGQFSAATIYGDDDSGSFNTLILNGSGYDVITAGYYLVKADTATGMYSVRPTTWNLFGTAKPNFPGANTLLVYDQSEKVWRITLNLKSGYEIKFRTNGTSSAAFVLGKYSGASDGTLNFGGPLLTYNGGDLTVPGTRTPITIVSYNVVLDLSSPRNYKYSITPGN
ncbi:MAG: SusE domain-containing protein [Burkholderiales bacterium]|nr:SusE domain-containing protein [Flavobacterium sp.]